MTLRFKTLIAICVVATPALLFGCSTSNQADDEVTIYFARHGKTLFNTFDLVQGWADSPLTDQGIKVAECLGKGLKDIKFDAYYTSDAGRQRETLQVILQQMHVKTNSVHELKGLREVFYGGYEGGPNRKIVTDTMKLVGYDSINDYFTAYKNGLLPVDKQMQPIKQTDPKHLAETYAEVKLRTQGALHTMVENAIKNGDKTILAVSSGMAMQVMISDLTDDIAKNKPLSNAAVVKMTYKNGQYQVQEIGNMNYAKQGCDNENSYKQ